jgi:holo-[acyl-carrier protein] synthase
MMYLTPTDNGLNVHSFKLLNGFDLVKISGLVESVQCFGDKFRQRLFTAAELDYADSSNTCWGERLAARFAAKEATIKALGLADIGISWRNIEVCKLPDGGCSLVLHGPVREIADRLHVVQMALSLSHDGDYAGAYVNMLCQSTNIN